MRGGCDFTAGLEWEQENPNRLRYTPFGESTRQITRGGADVGTSAETVTRIPAEHPEGYLGLSPTSILKLQRYV